MKISSNSWSNYQIPKNTLPQPQYQTGSSNKKESIDSQAQVVEFYSVHDSEDYVDLNFIPDEISADNYKAIFCYQTMADMLKFEKYLGINLYV